MNFTDKEIEELVAAVSEDVMGTAVNPDRFAALRFVDDKSLTDAIRYPDDTKKQFVLGSIIMGASMESAFEHLPDEEAFLRGKILVQFLKQFGIHIE